MTLTDDAPPVEVGFARASYTVAEGGTVTVTVELSAVPEREVEVALTHTAQGDTTAADYSGVPASVTFAPSETEQTFTFTAAADDVDDDGDSVLLGFGTLPDEVSAPDTTARPASSDGEHHRRRRAAGAGVLRAGRLHRCGGLGGNGDGAPGRCSRAPGVGADHGGESGRHDGGGLLGGAHARGVRRR